MKTKAAIAWKAGAPLTIEEVDLEGPRAGEVLIEVKATGICHTDYDTLSGADPEGIFPAILGHEGAGVVIDTALQAADRGYVMDSGTVTISGDAKQMLDDPTVRAAYLGE
ncbi:hypothetical protein PTKU46_42530 [Paraburkholderia terrae]